MINSSLIETEKSVLGTLLVDTEAMQRIGSSLRSEDFFLLEHQTVYKTIEILRVQQLDVNILSVLNVLERNTSTQIDMQYLSDLTNHMVDTNAVMTFATQVVQASGTRFLTREIEVMSKELSEGSGSLTEFVTKMSATVSKVASKTFSPTEKYGDSLRDDFMTIFSEAKSELVLTGIPEIDEAIVDFSPGEIIVIAARPGVGKSAIMLQSVRHQIAKGKTVGFISLEMSEKKLMMRLVSSLTGKNSKDLLKMSEEEFLSDQNNVDAVNYLTQNEQLVIDRGLPDDVDNIERIMRKMKYVHNVDVIYLDYLQLVTGSKFDKSSNRQEEVSRISRRLKGLSGELNLPIVEAAQLNRDSVRRAGGAPMISDLRESGSIEQDASIIIFLYADLSDTLSDEQKDDYIKNAPVLNIKIEIAKQRNGEVGVYEATFHKTVGKFVGRNEGNLTTEIRY